MLPQAGSFTDGDDHTDEERKLINETRKILGDGEIRRLRHLRPRARLRPATRRRSTSRPASRSARAAPASCSPAAPGVNVVDDPAAARLPDGDRRRRQGRRPRRPHPPRPGNERALNLWVVADNLRKGAATNAVQVAELLVERNLLHR